MQIGIYCRMSLFVQSVPPIQVEKGNAMKRSRESKQNHNGANEQSSSSSVEPATKKVKVDVEEIEDVTVGGSSDKLWLKFDRHIDHGRYEHDCKRLVRFVLFLAVIHNNLCKFHQWIMFNVGLLL